MFLLFSARSGAVFLASLLWVALACAQAITPAASRVVAVWDFDNHTVPVATTLSDLDFLNRSLSEATLGALLADPGLRVVDRMRLHEVLAEQKIGASRLADEDARLKLGRILGAQRMVFGSFMAIGDQIQVTVRAVDTATSQVMVADQFVSPYPEVLAQAQAMAAKLAQGLGGRVMAKSAAPTAQNRLWAAFDRVLALTDAAQYEQSIAALQALLTQYPDFEPAQRHLTAVLAKLARQ